MKGKSLSCCRIFNWTAKGKRRWRRTGFPLWHMKRYWGTSYCAQKLSLLMWPVIPTRMDFNYWPSNDAQVLTSWLYYAVCGCPTNAGHPLGTSVRKPCQILPRHVFWCRVCFLICDGDAQQNLLELRIAVKKLFPPYATIGGCSFHLFNNDRNWHVGTINWKNSRKPAWTTFVRRIHTWMYSYTRPGYCLTKKQREWWKIL